MDVDEPGQDELVFVIDLVGLAEAPLRQAIPRAVIPIEADVHIGETHKIQRRTGSNLRANRLPSTMLQRGRPIIVGGLQQTCSCREEQSYEADHA